MGAAGWTGYAAAALAGLCVGSFLNTCIHRLPQGRSVVRPRSACPACGRALGAADLIPVASYLASRGRCRHCGAPIGAAYPLVELATAALAVLSFHIEGPTPALLRTFGLGSVFLAVAAADLRWRVIPDALVAAGLLIALAGAPWSGRLSAMQAAAGLLAGGGAFALLRWAYRRLRGREGMGGGDVKLAALMGAALGVWGWLLAVMAASAAGVAVGVVLILRGRASWQSALPFGAFLAAAALALLLLPVIGGGF